LRVGKRHREGRGYRYSSSANTVCYKQFWTRGMRQIATATGEYSGCTAWEPMPIRTLKSATLGRGN
jgi:hypothetical protein